jgi:hypothetical protein
MKLIPHKVAQLLAAGFALAVSGGSGAAAFLLPTPENNTYATYGTYTDALGTSRDAIMMNGIPIAFKYDNFWSYSAHVLDAIQADTNPTNFLPVATFGTYDFSVGTGNIAVNITTNAGGATNVNPNGSGVNFQDPVNLGSSNTDKGWTGVWGGNTQTYVETPVSGQSYSDPASLQGGTTTVGNLLTYLNTLIPNASVPVLYADYNQTGNADSLWLSGMVQIWDSTQTTMKAEWNLDAINGSGLNINAPAFNFGTINFYGTTAACTAAGPYDPVTGTGCAGVTTNGDAYTKLNHNKGSGKPDFFAYAPDMDLSQFLGSDLFVVTFNLGCIPGGAGPLGGTGSLGCNTNGGEEFGIVGAVTTTSQVPEPGALALLGVGLLGLAYSRRRIA